MTTSTKEAVLVRGLQTVYITVRQFERSLEFYRKLLGVKEQALVPWGTDHEERGAFFELQDGTRFIISYEVSHASPPRRQYIWLELQVDDPQEYYEQLRVKGLAIKQTPYETAGGSKAFDVTDPDGNDIRIGTRWNIPR